ncbi:MAG: phospholipase, partial [Pseudomonadota bacterium]
MTQASPPPTLDGPRRGAATGAPTALIMLLHGYGADGNDLFGLSGPLAQVFPGAAFVSPNAPEPCRAAPFGRQWFPIPWIDGSSDAEMTESFARSSTALDGFIDAECEAHGLGPDRCLLLGFSQGTMMSLHLGLRRPEPVAGIVGFSGRLAVPERLAQEITARPPVLLTHG